MNTYEIKITNIYYSTGDNAMEALDHLSEFFDLDYDDEIKIKVVEGELK